MTDETGAAVAAIKIKLHLVSEPEQAFMESVNADIARLNNNSVLADASGPVEKAISVAQTGSEAAKTLSTCIVPLGKALQLIVKFMDGIADV